MAKPFDFVNSVTDGKNDMIAEGADERDYVPYLTNRSLSQHADTVLYANEMNLHHHLPNALQYHYLLHSVRKKKRYSKWHKEEEERARRAKLVSERFGMSPQKARQALELLSESQLAEIEETLERGGY